MILETFYCTHAYMNDHIGMKVIVFIKTFTIYKIVFI
jgi:hypothetical protein